MEENNELKPYYKFGKYNDPVEKLKKARREWIERYGPNSYKENKEPNFQEILKAKREYYGDTEAAIEFAAEEYARQLIEFENNRFLR
ncbi:hypothetical protein AHMF7605_11750 [Adhaeribacter arboris]|uniref:Uncharacterized protein n=1 Tax=Adhaeribacter arboris TaxID=2072846 RepID=A0A2T2YF52_9BACT|nr:hypothetical protein [Adhaeribacter arboris]PSR54145.1 hypothetical protein AHMF7605_11750 [Adhaeribacter arboris]